MLRRPPTSPLFPTPTLSRPLRGVRLARPTDADHEPGAPVRQHVEARPLLGEEHRVAVDERRETPDTEPEPARHPREGREERDGLQTRLGEEAVAYPDGVEDAGTLGLDGEIEKRARLDRAEDDSAVRQDQPEGVSHGLSPRILRRSLLEERGHAQRAAGGRAARPPPGSCGASPREMKPPTAAWRYENRTRPPARGRPPSYTRRWPRSPACDSAPPRSACLPTARDRPAPA